MLSTTGRAFIDERRENSNVADRSRGLQMERMSSMLAYFLLLQASTVNGMPSVTGIKDFALEGLMASE